MATHRLLGLWLGSLLIGESTFKNRYLKGKQWELPKKTIYFSWPLGGFGKVICTSLNSFRGCLNSRALYGHRSSLLENLRKCLLALIVDCIKSWT
jgi:hypothetical protein